MIFPPIRVHGYPYPKGSMIPGVTRDGRPYMRHVEAFELKHWSGLIRAAATFKWGSPSLTEPCFVISRLFVPKANRKYHDKDTDKLERAILDALTLAGIYKDDKWVKATLTQQEYVSNIHPTPGAIIWFGVMLEFPDAVRAFLAESSEKVLLSN